MTAYPDSMPSRTRLTVGEVMSSRVVTVSMDDTLAKVQALFRESRFHHLLVLDHGRLVGIISDRDLLKALSPAIGTLMETDRDRATLNKRAHQVMSRHPVTATADLAIETAARLLIDRKVSCLPIVSNDQTPVGMLSWKDVVNALCPPACEVPPGNVQIGSPPSAPRPRGSPSIPP